MSLAVVAAGSDSVGPEVAVAEPGQNHLHDSSVMTHPVTFGALVGKPTLSPITGTLVELIAGLV